MNLEAEMILSFYKEVSVIDAKKCIILVQHIESGDLFVKKQVPQYCLDIYMQLKGCGIRGIAEIFEVIEDDNNLIIIEEYVKGRTLQRKYEEEGALTIEEAADYMLQLSFALSEMHKMTPPVIHRDVKPENVMLTSSGQLKLIDFNAAKNENKEQNTDTHMLGTRNFAAPEQYGFGRSDIRTDIYGVGSTMNYMLTGLYPNEHIYDVGKMSKVIEKCLKLEATERYQDMMELHRAVDEAIGNDKSRYLPVGFRSKNIWFMCMASIYYIVSIVFSFTGEEDDTFAPLPEMILWLIISIGTLLWFGDYLDCRTKLLGGKRWGIKNLLLSVLLWLVVVICLIFIM